MKKTPIPVHHLELRVRELGQLFNSMDPTPFLNKDLDREAEAFIETWALGLPPKAGLVRGDLKQLLKQGRSAC